MDQITTMPEALGEKMKKVIINRITNISSTLQIVWDNVTDFTHFIPLHWKHFKKWDLIYEQENLMIFHYQSRVLYPFNFAKNYIGIRIMDAPNYSFTQMYYCPDDDKNPKMFLQAQLIEKDDRVEVHNRLVFYVKGIWACFPKFFAKLVNYRAQRMWVEDKEIIEVRNKVGGFTDDKCLAPIESFHQEVVKNMEKFQDLFTPSPNDTFAEFYIKEEPVNKQG
jgi:hypothetical protein